MFKRILAKSIKSSRKDTFANLYFLASKSAVALIILPLIFSKYDSNDQLLWYIYFSLFVVVQIFDLGIVSVSSRFLSYSPGLYAGMDRDNWSQGVRFVHNEKICREMLLSYLFLGILSFVILFFAYRTFYDGGQEVDLTGSDFVVMSVFASLSLVGNYFISTSNALGKYGDCQIIRGHFQWASLVFAAVVRSMDGTLFQVALAFHGIQVTSVFAIGAAYYKLRGARVTKIPRGIRREFWKHLAKAVTNTFLGLVVIVALQQFSSMYVAKHSSPYHAVQFFFYMQVLKAANMFGRSPVYSRLASMYPIFADNSKANLNSILKSSVQGCTMYAVLVVTGYIFVEMANKLGASFPAMTYIFWALALYFLLELLCGMLAEILTLSGQVLWGICSISLSVVFIATFLLFKNLDTDLQMTISLIIGYSIGFLPIVASRVRREMHS